MADIINEKKTLKLWTFACVFILFNSIQAQSLRVILGKEIENDPVAYYGVETFRNTMKEVGWNCFIENDLSPLRKYDYQVLLGFSGGNEVANRLFETAGVIGPKVPQSYALVSTSWKGSPVTIVMAYDSNGLIYALQEYAEIAQELGNRSLFLELPSTGSPFIEERAISKTVMNPSEFERYFYNDNYWNEYFDMLVKNRYTTFVLIMGYNSTGYFSPPYPYLFDVPGFESVKVLGLSAESQLRNRKALDNIINAAHKRGLLFKLGIWTHIHRGLPEEMDPIGINDENLLAYTQKALPKLLKTYPGLDGLQFRVHFESSLPLPRQLEFWNSIYNAIGGSVHPNIAIDMRAKGFTDDLIDQANQSGLNIRITTKFWGEQMGLPYAPLQLGRADQFIRRHGYADLLNHPKQMKMHYRLWNFGTTRVLPWADPQYAKNFVKNVVELDGDGFEVNEPLAFKMAGVKGNTYDVLQKKYQYYDWEWKRYSHFYQIFGRIGYDPNLNENYCISDFENSYGKIAGPLLMSAFHKASRILPRINAYALYDISADYSWAEKQRWGDLPTYASTLPSDVGQFLSMQKATRLDLAGKTSPKVHPNTTARWFENQSKDVMDLVNQAEKEKKGPMDKAFTAMIKDLTILSLLGDYHAKRIPAGMNYALYTQTGNSQAYLDALKSEKEAINTWKKIVELTEGYFNDDLIMGDTKRMRGNWKDELNLLEEGYKKLSNEDYNAKTEPQKIVTYDMGPLISAKGDIKIDAPQTAPWYQQFDIGNHGWTNNNIFIETSSNEWTKRSLQHDSDRDFLRGPHQTAYATFSTKIPNGNYRIDFVMFDSRDTPEDYGHMWLRANGINKTSEFKVPAGERVVRSLEARVTDGWLNLTVASKTNSMWLLNSISIYDLGPSIVQMSPKYVKPNQPYNLTVLVKSLDSIKKAVLTYGDLLTGMNSVPMKKIQPGRFQAMIPALESVEKLNYKIDIEDVQGRCTSYPKTELDNPFASIFFTNDFEAPIVEHEPIISFSNKDALVIRAKVSDASAIKSVYVKFRGLNQHQDYGSVALIPKGNGYYEAVIPESLLPKKWDLMYYFEACDNHGNITMFPDFEKRTPYFVARYQKLTNHKK